MLEMQNISHYFEKNTPLYENVNIKVSPHQSLCILGVSGSGKSSILNHASTMLKPNLGSVQILKNNIYTLSQDELLKIRRKEIGIIFQHHYLLRGFKAIENIKIGAILSLQDLDEKIFTQLKIEHILEQQVGTLSGGQQQRVSIARALAKRPKIIIADEPTGNLDSATANDVMKVIFDYINQNKACLILATHDEQIAKKCSQVYRLENLKLVAV